MRDGSFQRLSDRGVLWIGGAEAEGFLQNIVTTDMGRVNEGHAGFGALLSPQGKILVDFLIFRSGDGYWLDLPLAQLADFQKRMTLYRLRAKVEIANRSDKHEAVAIWNVDELPAVDGIVAVDPRLAGLGFRAIVERETALDGTEGDYQAWRISHAVPEGGRDFTFGDAFPHDVDMDDLGGLDFRKGCYVGQEIVSRMEHRGTARRRAVAVASNIPLPAIGTLIEADGKPIGTLGSSNGSSGIALIRLDRAKRALDQGTPLTAEGAPLQVALPAFAHFGWPQATEEEGAA